LPVSLHDLTGFEGRCDAILVTADLDFVPPNDLESMTAFRRKCLGLPPEPEAEGKYDLVVVGGGIAGTCAAVSAARLDLHVALIQDRPVLGGNNSSEIRVWLQGARNVKPYPRLGDVVRELEQPRSAHYGPGNTADLYEDDRKLALAKSERNIRLYLSHRANAVTTDNGRLSAVIAQDIVSGRRVRVSGRWFADCTGDGCIGFLAGADFDMTVPGHLGRCNLWNVIDTGKPSPFPRCSWALDLSDRPFPGRSKTKPDPTKLGGWYWESGFDHDPIEKGEYIRDWNFRAMDGAWDAMKNVDKVLPNHRLNWSAHICGKRESRRLMGDVVLERDDLITDRRYEDGCVPTGWKIDLHLPDKRYEKGFEGDAFIAKADFGKYTMPYWIPYRCLYSRNVPNLFMAGRDISVTHEALGAIRVMRTTGMMGEVVGMAAAICARHAVNPRGVYAKYLDELKALMRKGVGKALPAGLAPPSWIDRVGPNVAPGAKTTSSGDRDAERYPLRHVNDGKIDTFDDDSRWLSDETVPNGVELAWARPQTLGGVRIVSGYRGAGPDLSAALADFEFQSYRNGAWHLIPGTRTHGNTRNDWHVRIEPVTTRRLRLLVTRVHSNVSRIWEIELYAEQPAPR